MNPRSEYIIEIVAENIRKARKEKGLTIVQLADLCELEKITVSRIERKITNPTISTIAIIAKALNVEASDLLKK